jgi:hypothetical protein
MPARFARSALIVLIVLGLLLPRMSAAIALVAPGGEVVVICTGTGLQTLIIDADGNPVPVSMHADHCLLAHAADTSDRVAPEPHAAPLAGSVAGPTGDLVRLSDYAAARPPPRAPPSA